MSAFTGPQRKGAMRELRTQKRLDAIERTTRTAEERRGYNKPHAKPEATREPSA